MELSFNSLSSKRQSPQIILFFTQYPRICHTNTYLESKRLYLRKQNLLLILREQHRISFRHQFTCPKIVVVSPFVNNFSTRVTSTRFYSKVMYPFSNGTHLFIFIFIFGFHRNHLILQGYLSKLHKPKYN